MDSHSCETADTASTADGILHTLLEDGPNTAQQAAMRSTAIGWRRRGPERAQNGRKQGSR